MKSAFGWILLAALTCVSVAALAAPKQTPSERATAENRTAPGALEVADHPQVTVEAGQSTVVLVTLDIAPGHHVQANPAGNEFLVPLQVVLDDAEALTADNVTYPRGKPYMVGLQELPVYSDRVRVSVTVVASPGANPGPRVMRGEVRYQACTSSHCLFPAKQPFELNVTIEPAPRLCTGSS